MRRFFNGAGVALLGLAGATFYLTRNLPWSSSPGSPVAGSTLPKLFAWVIILGLLFLAGFCFIRANGGGESAYSRFSPDAEESRMRRDPRFRPGKRPSTEG